MQASKGVTEGRQNTKTNKTIRQNNGGGQRSSIKTQQGYKTDTTME